MHECVDNQMRYARGGEWWEKEGRNGHRRGGEGEMQRAGQLTRGEIEEGRLLSFSRCAFACVPFSMQRTSGVEAIVCRW